MKQNAFWNDLEKVLSDPQPGERVLAVILVVRPLMQAVSDFEGLVTSSQFETWQRVTDAYDALEEALEGVS
jgi:hypothetical protein